MIFSKKKILVWCDDPPEDPVISIFAGCLANNDRAHSQDRTPFLRKRVLPKVSLLSSGGESLIYSDCLDLFRS
jgi:hypothetical protein